MRKPKVIEVEAARIRRGQTEIFKKKKKKIK